MSQHKHILHDQAAWIAYFKEKTLPVRASSAKKLQQLINSPSSTIASITQWVSRDPLLCMRIAQAAQQQLPTSSSVNSIEHAIQTLGFDQLGQLAKESQVIKLNPLSMQHVMFMRSVQDSHHMAYQAHAWLTMKKMPHTPTAFMAALSESLINWFAWLFAPLQQEACYQRRLQEGLSKQRAETEIYGCTLAALGGELCQQLQYPRPYDAAQAPLESLSDNPLKTLYLKAIGDPNADPQQLRRLNIMMQHPQFAITLSAWLIDASNNSWQSKTCQQILYILSDYLRMEKEATQAHVHQLCVQSSNQSFAPGVFSPASELLLLASSKPQKIFSLQERQQLHSSCPPVQATQTSSPPHVTPIATPQDTFRDKQAFLRCIRALKQPHSAFANNGQVLKQMIIACTEGLGLKRICVLGVSTDQLSAKTLACRGFNAEHLFTHYKVPLNSPSLFQRMITQPRCLHYNQTTSTTLKPLLPKRFKQSLPEHDWLITSLFADTQALYIIYADLDHSAPPMSKFYQQQFSFLGKLVSSKLTSLKTA